MSLPSAGRLAEGSIDGSFIGPVSRRQGVGGVISSRRLAREWALKILYQMDVGKVALEEALESALDRLRREFVQRGSRTASGSPAEEIGLDLITHGLREVLPTLRFPLERALVAAVGRLFEEGPYWQEVRTERALKTQLPGVPLVPPRLLVPLSSATLLAIGTHPEEGPEALTEAERAALRTFVAVMRAELPRLLEPGLRKTARVFAKDVAAHRPLACTPAVLQEYLRQRREEFNAEAAAHWHKVGAMVQKQVGDWLRTASFTTKLVTGAHAKQGEIDRAVTALSSGWKLERQVAVDRNILRLAGFEMLFVPGIPTSASINEAVELAKKYSTSESGRFVNGVLGALAAQVGDKVAAATADGTLETDGQEESIDLPEILDLEEQ
jgi:N utilization substance protein B